MKRERKPYLYTLISLCVSMCICDMKILQIIFSLVNPQIVK